MDSTARRLFRLFIEQPDADIDLGRAALAIASEEYPQLDSQGYMRRIERLGDMVRRTAEQSSKVSRLGALIEVLANVEGLRRSNRAAYEDPRNSFLNEVTSIVAEWESPSASR